MGFGDLTIETENGVAIDGVDVYIGDVVEIIHTSLSEEFLSNTHCLQYIDPYGNSIFNMLQKKRLAIELEDLKAQFVSKDGRECIDRMIEITNRYKDEVHIYIKFHGD